MKYYIDTEFIEGFHKPLFGKKRHFIDLISIGIIAEDGREYYAISKEYDYSKADEWVQKNVILPMYQQEMSGFKQQFTDITTFHKYSSKSRSLKTIASEIMAFVNPPSGEDTLNYKSWNDHLNEFKVVATENRPLEFYGYYAEYDWVLFCSLFGRMIDLPEGFPMYCRDLKQMLDQFAESHGPKNGDDPLIVGFKSHPNYPIQTNEHNALADAKWNMELHKFIQSL